MNDSVKYVNYNQLFTRHHPKSFASSLHRFLPTKCKNVQTYIFTTKQGCITAENAQNIDGKHSVQHSVWSEQLSARWLAHNWGEVTGDPAPIPPSPPSRGRLAEGSCPAVQHSTVQYSAVQEWEHGTMLDCLVMTGDPRWPRPGSNWKLQIGDQITSVTYNLYPGSSLQTPIYIPPSFVCLMWVFLRKDKHWTIKRTTHNLHLLFIFI